MLLNKFAISLHIHTFVLIFVTIFALSCADKQPTESNPPPQVDHILSVPSEYPTIQSAINAYRDGMEIVLSDGIYSGAGNRNLRITDKSIKIRSENGPAKTIIDCNADSLNQSRAFSIENLSSTNTIIEGITIRNAYFSSGAAVYCKTTSPVFKSCVFQDNVSIVSGGAIRLKSASPTFVNCTFVGNSASIGGAIFTLASSSPVLQNCIIAFSDSGQSVAVSDAGSQPQLLCCNVFGNVGGDWPSAISGQASANGNFSSEPFFCDPDNGDFRLQPQSPCSPAINSCGVLIGALPVGCSP